VRALRCEAVTVGRGLCIRLDEATVAQAYADEAEIEWILWPGALAVVVEVFVQTGLRTGRIGSDAVFGAVVAGYVDLRPDVSPHELDDGRSRWWRRCFAIPKTYTPTSCSWARLLIPGTFEAGDEGQAIGWPATLRAVS